MIRLSCAFRQVLDLVVLDRDLGTKKAYLAVLFAKARFQLLNMAEHVGARSRLLRYVFLA